jgi:hypothetical protein
MQAQEGCGQAYRYCIKVEQRLPERPYARGLVVRLVASLRLSEIVWWPIQPASRSRTVMLGLIAG